MHDSLGDRMKTFENSYRLHLPPRMPLIIRVDGKSFSSYTKSLPKPFCPKLDQVMNITAQELCKNISGVQCAFVQSDEISLLLNNYKKFNTQPWFNNNIQKITSVSAAIAATTFTINSPIIWDKIKPAYFDSRAWVLPEKEVRNYFIWRQNDIIRNSVSSLAQSLFSHKELHGKNTTEMKSMCIEKNHNWDNFHSHNKFGRFMTKQLNSSNWIIQDDTPNFILDETFKNTMLKFIEQDEA